MNTGHVAVVVRRPGQPERRVSVGLGVAHLGRAEDNDIVLTDIGVSRRHARLVVQESGVTIEDLGSGNGTYFRGSRVNRQPVRDGDEFLIDPFRLVIEIEAIEPMAADGLTGIWRKSTTTTPPRFRWPFRSSALRRGRRPSGAPRHAPRAALAPSYVLRDGGLSVVGPGQRHLCLIPQPVGTTPQSNHSAVTFGFGIRGAEMARSSMGIAFESSAFATATGCGWGAQSSESKWWPPPMR